MKNHFTRMASLLLAFGLLFGCSSSLPSIYQARMSMDRAQYDKALQAINKEISSNPANPEAYYLKGNILFEMALDKKNPSSRTSYFKDMRSALLKSRSLYQDSSSTLHSVELNNINDLLKNGWLNEYRSGLAFIKSDTLTKTMSSRKALAHFNNAITLIPDSIQAYRHKARILYRQGKYDSAITTLTSILDKHQRPSPSTLEQLAYLYKKTGATERAITLYEKAFKQVENNANLAHGLINAYIDNEAHQAAVDLLDKLIQRHPNNSSYRLTYAEELYKMASAHLDTIRFESKKSESTEEKWGSDSNDPPPEIRSHWHRADTLVQNARYQYSIADSLNPRSAQIDYSAALFYKNLALDYREVAPILSNISDHSGKTVNKYLKSAVSHLENAVKLNPDNPQYWDQLYQLYKHFGMEEKAKKARKKANL